jgi:hypothetical protein
MIEMRDKFGVLEQNFGAESQVLAQASQRLRDVTLVVPGWRMTLSSCLPRFAGHEPMTGTIILALISGVIIGIALGVTAIALADF